MTALEIVNEVQKRLRLPQPAAFTDKHSAMILAFLNDVQRNLMTERCIWDELKESGALTTADGTSLYEVAPAGSNVLDKLLYVERTLDSGGAQEVYKKTDTFIRDYKRITTTTSEPLYWRFYGNVLGGSKKIELVPTPDGVYSLPWEGVIKPPMLTDVAHVPLLDSDSLILGTILKARAEQGEDITEELAEWKLKISDQSISQGDSNFGDSVELY